MAIPQNIIDQVRDRSDIVEIVGQYVDLKRAGTGYKGLCPFHQERTPSFNVNPERQGYHCFGCGRGGNVFQFLMEMDGVTFPEAVRELAERAGIEVETKPAEDERSENDALYKANTFAARYYHRMLVNSPSAEKARAYLLGRDIPREAWTRFGLGFAPASGDALVQEARRQRIPPETLLKLRLIAAREGRTGHYDYFRDRVVFPIIQPGARVVGFGARTLGDGEPKYLNSAESAIFLKRRTFYGLDRARDPIRSHRFAVIVEGYTDLIRLHLVGIDNTIATCGTALTRDHAEKVRRLTRRVVLMPDGDDAGAMAAMISGALLMAEGVEVGIARLDAGLDPDSAGKAMSTKELEELVGSPLEYFQYLDYTIQHQQPSAREREEIIRRIVSAIAQSDDPLRGDVLVGELARVVGVEASALRRLLRPSGRPAPETQRTGSTGSRTGSTRWALERVVMRLVMEGTPTALDALDALDVEDFSDEDNRKFYKLLDSAREAHIDLRGRDFQRLAAESGLEDFATEISLVAVPPGNVETLQRDHIKDLKRRRIEDELDQLRESLLNLPAESDETISVTELIRRLEQAKREL
ncbi:MAG: DNA primase [Candidatus Krumholzibacteria bacterium]|nr:DNA primase [Candidatus Krumholzibacteria bacterium]MDH5270244.1 DNA primase [Candidatus Krumholzibacteria bacterium]